MKNKKCVISEKADEALQRMLETANKSFQEGSISKQGLLSWLVENFEDRFEKCLPQIRRQHFDPIKVLKLQILELEKAKREGTAEPSVDNVIAALKSSR